MNCPCCNDPLGDASWNGIAMADMPNGGMLQCLSCGALLMRIYGLASGLRGLSKFEWDQLRKQEPEIVQHINRVAGQLLYKTDVFAVPKSSLRRIDDGS